MAWAGGKQTKAKRVIDMREFIEGLLMQWDLGTLVAVDGPTATSDDWYKLIVKYRPEENRHREDVQFYDKRIEINIGYSRKAGYWNRRCIRLAIAAEGRERQDDKIAEVVWSSAQRELTTGREREDGGAFAL